MSIYNQGCSAVFKHNISYNILLRFHYFFPGWWYSTSKHNFACPTILDQVILLVIILVIILVNLLLAMIGVSCVLFLVSLASRLTDGILSCALVFWRFLDYTTRVFSWAMVSFWIKHWRFWSRTCWRWVSKLLSFLQSHFTNTLVLVLH